VPTNWEGGSAPTTGEEIGTLKFPRLTNAACEPEQETEACYFSFNDVSGLSAESMQIDDGDGYFIGGETLALGAGGLTASPGSGASGPAGDLVLMPLHLRTTQTWSVSEREAGEIEENGLLLAGEVTGSAASALTVDLSSGPALILDNDTETGPVTIEGPNATGEHIDNGSVLLEGGELNASDRQAVNLSRIFFAGAGAVGSLTTNDATVDVGADKVPAGVLEASSVKLDSASGVLFEITGSGTTARSDYSQLLSEGPVALAGSIAVVSSKPTASGSCPDLVAGATYTFLSTSGTLSGTFANAPEGGPEIPISFGEGCSQSARTMRISYNRSGTTKTVTGTVEAESVEKKQEEASQKTAHEEELRKLAEEPARKVGEEAAATQAAIKKHEEEAAAATKRNQEEATLIAAAKKHLEEEAAKGGVLASKERSPDAMLAGTSLQASAAGAVNIKISCPSGERSCTGTIVLRTLNALSASFAGAAKTNDSILTLASGPFNIPGGEVKTVTLHLSAQARKLLARSRMLRVRATIFAHNPTGGIHTGQTIATLRVHETRRG
jgi:hypothetical protein